MTVATVGILQKADPALWREHRFGLPPERWAQLAGRPIWITGAGTGFGQAMAVALAATGSRVILTGRRPAKLEDTVALAATYGIPTDAFMLLPADVTDPDQVMAATDAIGQRCGPLHALVNNAALSQRPAGRWPLGAMTVEQWNSQLATNVTAPWLTTRAVVPAMAKAGTVRVLFVSSEAGWAATPGVGSYNMSKAALNSLASSWAAEIADGFPDCDVQVNTLIPGEARTEMNQGSNESPFSVVSMALALLSHPPGGPNGRFFHRDGRHFSFAYSSAYGHPLL